MVLTVPFFVVDVRIADEDVAHRQLVPVADEEIAIEQHSANCEGVMVSRRSLRPLHRAVGGAHDPDRSRASRQVEAAVERCCPGSQQQTQVQQILDNERLNTNNSWVTLRRIRSARYERCSRRRIGNALRGDHDVPRVRRAPRRQFSRLVRRRDERWGFHVGALSCNADYRL